MRLAAGSAKAARDLIADAVTNVGKGLEVEFMFDGYGPVEIDTDVQGLSSLLKGSDGRAADRP